jgi:hypothetical protein
MYPGTYNGTLVFLPDKIGIVRYSEIVAQWQQLVDAGTPQVDAAIKVAESYGVSNSMIGGILENRGMMKWWVDA